MSPYNHFPSPYRTHHFHQFHRHRFPVLLIVGCLFNSGPSQVSYSSHYKATKRKLLVQPQTPHKLLMIIKAKFFNKKVFSYFGHDQTDMINLFKPLRISISQEGCPLAIGYGLSSLLTSSFMAIASLCELRYILYLASSFISQTAGVDSPPG